MDLKKNSWPHFSAAEIDAVSHLLLTGKVNYWTGTEGRFFEQEYAEFVNVPYAIAVMNGTVALEAALYALDIGPGDEVITTCRTFIASASVIVTRGATPILADVDLNSQNITAETIAPLITQRTKAILVVHLAGWPCDMDPILDLAKKHNLYVIEDCAQAHGASYKKRPVGGLGDIAAFSFCQDKIITTGGEGGMVTTRHKHLWEKIWAYKDHGKSYDAVYNQEHPPGFRWLHQSFGTNWRMTEMQAAIGRIQLRKLPEWRSVRERNASILRKNLNHCPAIRLTMPPNTVEHAYYKYYVFVRPELLKPGWNRDRIMQSITEQGVPCFTGICSEIYLEQAFKEAELGPKNRLPVAKLLGETSLLFLVHPTLSESEMHKIADIITEVITNASIIPETIVI